MGLKWLLDSTAFMGTGSRTVDFTLITPRQAAVDMLGRMKDSLHGSFLNLTLDDPDSALAANIMNRWVAEFATVAWDLKYHRLVADDTAFDKRVEAAQNSLESLERRLAGLPPQGETGAGSPRSVQEGRLKRSVETAAAIEARIETESQEWKLNLSDAEVPDFSILDSAIAPKEPMDLPRPTNVVSIVFASIGALLTLSVLIAMTRRGAEAYVRWIDAEEPPEEELDAHRLPEGAL